MGIKRAAWTGKLKNLTRAGVDSSVLIYHLEDMPPYADLTEALFAAVMEGSLRVVLSTTSVTELLVRPYSEIQLDRVGAFEQFLFSLPNTDLVSPDYSISKEAARLRARYRMRTPDAILIATSLQQKADAFLTNDTHLGIIKEEGLDILVLDDFIDP